MCDVAATENSWKIQNFSLYIFFKTPIMVSGWFKLNFYLYYMHIAKALFHFGEFIIPYQRLTYMYKTIYLAMSQLVLSWCKKSCHSM
jgi:hypothetical protein